MSDPAQPPEGDALAGLAGLLAEVRADSARREELTAMLAEQHPLFRGRGSTEVERMRGDILACFEEVGLPDDALPFIIEELETGQSAAAVAAAAKAVRGAAGLPARILPLLVDAIARFAGRDEFVRQPLEEPGTSRTASTVTAELIRTLARTGAEGQAALRELCSRGEGAILFSRPAREAVEACLAAAPAAGSLQRQCCGGIAGAPAADTRSPRPNPALGAAAWEALLEDQDGKATTLREMFAGRGGLVTFFYTRCMNPAKCSSTLTKLARLQARIGDGRSAPPAIAAISYDPAYDLAPRLRSYGQDRGFQFAPESRLLRTIGDIAPLRAAFELGVGYGPSTVHRHRIELFVLDCDLRIRAAFTRTAWREDEVLACLAGIRPPPSAPAPAAADPAAPGRAVHPCPVPRC